MESVARPPDDAHVGHLRRGARPRRRCRAAAAALAHPPARPLAFPVPSRVSSPRTEPAGSGGRRGTSACETFEVRRRRVEARSEQAPWDYKSRQSRPRSSSGVPKWPSTRVNVPGPFEVVRECPAKDGPGDGPESAPRKHGGRRERTSPTGHQRALRATKLTRARGVSPSCDRVSMLGQPSASEMRAAAPLRRRMHTHRPAPHRPTGSAAVAHPPERTTDLRCPGEP